MVHICKICILMKINIQKISKNSEMLTVEGSHHEVGVLFWLSKGQVQEAVCVPNVEFLQDS